MWRTWGCQLAGFVDTWPASKSSRQRLPDLAKVGLPSFGCGLLINYLPLSRPDAPRLFSNSGRIRFAPPTFLSPLYLLQASRTSEKRILSRSNTNTIQATFELGCHLRNTSYLTSGTPWLGPPSSSAIHQMFVDATRPLDQTFIPTTR